MDPHVNTRPAPGGSGFLLQFVSFRRFRGLRGRLRRQLGGRSYVVSLERLAIFNERIRRGMRVPHFKPAAPGATPLHVAQLRGFFE
jgi:hypothetical protein